MSDITHGVDGWVLEDMDWNPDTGESVFEYSKITPEGVITSHVTRLQPTRLRHSGWWERDRTTLVFQLTARDWMRWDRGILGDPDPEEADYE